MKALGHSKALHHPLKGHLIKSRNGQAAYDLQVSRFLAPSAKTFQLTSQRLTSNAMALQLAQYSHRHLSPIQTLHLNMMPKSRFITSKAADVSQHTTAMHEAIAQENLERLKAILQTGVSPNMKDSLGRTPLYIAAELNNYIALVMLLLQGAKTYIRDKFDRSALEAAPAGSKTKAILHAMQNLFQLKNIRTGGYPVNLTPKLKEVLIQATLPNVSDHVAECLIQSYQLERQLLDPFSSEEQGVRIVLEHLNRLPVTGFLWLNSSFDGHSTNLTIARIAESKWLINKSNVGPGSEHHSKDPAGQIHPKVYDFNHNTCMNGLKQRVDFLERLSQRISADYKALKSGALVVSDTHYAEFISVFPQETTEITNFGTAFGPQETDNCAFISEWIGLIQILRKLAPSAEPSSIKARAEETLRESIIAAAPGLKNSHIDEILTLAKSHNLPLLTPAEIKLNRAETPHVSDDALTLEQRINLVIEAKKSFEAFLSMNETIRQEYISTPTDNDFKRAELGLVRCNQLLDQFTAIKGA